MALLFVVKKWVFGDLWHLLNLIFREVFEGAPIEFEDYLAVLNILLSQWSIHRVFEPIGKLYSQNPKVIFWISGLSKIRNFNIPGCSWTMWTVLSSTLSDWWSQKEHLEAFWIEADESDSYEWIITSAGYQRLSLTRRSYYFKLIQWNDRLLCGF